MIVTDLDNTLLRNDKTISLYTKSMLSKCLNHGFILTFATARPERTTKKWALNDYSCYVIANNGATIVSNTEIIYSVSIPNHEELISLFVNDSSVNGLCVEVGGFQYVNEAVYSTLKGTDDEGWNFVYHDFKTIVREDVYKISVECDDYNHMDVIMKRHPDLRLFPNNGESWYQITHECVSKYNAIAHLAQLMNMSTKEIVAFGDDYNDMEMIEKCGIGIAVANANNKVRAVADEICGSNEDDGVAQWLQFNLLSGREVKTH
jgi:Cof subfamily protein (haloacid dehalogenase superfamily)